MDVRFDSDGCVIAGTLTQVREPVAAALVITGIAEALTAANVMTLRYDKRGIGQSGGDYRHAGMTENTGEQIIEWQIGQIEPTIPGFAKAIMRLTGSDFVTSQHKRLDRLRSSSGDVIRMSGYRVNARWYREFFAWDPAPDVGRITAPVLAITGGHDMQVPPDDVEAIGGLVRGPFEGHVVDDLSHLLRPDPGSKGPRGYRCAVRQPVSPKVLSFITEWVTGRWGQAGEGSA